MEAEDEIHLREATRVAGNTTLLAAVFKENISDVKKRKGICQRKKSRPFIIYPGSHNEESHKKIKLNGVLMLQYSIDGWLFIITGFFYLQNN